jgi:hypothetical protein
MARAEGSPPTPPAAGGLVQLLQAGAAGDDFFPDSGGAAEDRLDAAEPPEPTFIAENSGLTNRPHDITDLYLAPVALAVDARIEELGRPDSERLAYEVALESDTPDFTRAMRGDALIRTVTHLIDCHDWVFSWDPAAFA